MALEIAVNTALRAGDIAKLGRQHVRNGVIVQRQGKTGGEPLQIPITADLQAAFDATPCASLTFLLNDDGRAFTAKALSNWFAKTARDAGLLPRRSLHGLRKAKCRRLPEAGCSENEIAAVSGHASLNEVARYTKSANRAKLAKAAMAKVAAAGA